MRFGNGPQMDGTDFEGHEIRLGYTVSKNINLLAGSLSCRPSPPCRMATGSGSIYNWKF